MEKRDIELFQIEIKKQCHFALYSIDSINQIMKPPFQNIDSDAVWFFIQSFLTATANVSKLLFGTKEQISVKRKPLRDSLNVSNDSSVKIRDMRNHFEHFDERVEKWSKTSKRQNFANDLIGPTNMISGFEVTDMFRHFDTSKGAIRFNGQEYLIQPVVDELARIQFIAEQQLKAPYWSK